MALVLDILLFAVINSFLVGFLLVINKKGNLTANRYYGLLTWAISAVALENILIMSGDIFNIPHLFSVGGIMMLLVPPFGYLLYRHLMDPSKKTHSGFLILHLLPFIVCSLSLTPLFLLSGELKVEIIQSIYFEHQSIRGFALLYSALNILQFVVYNLLIARNIRSYQANKTKKSQRFRLSWMSVLLLTMNGIVGAYLAVYLTFIYSTQFQPVLIVLFIVVMLSTVYLTGYQLVKNPFFFSTNLAAYERSTLNDQVSTELDRNLDIYLTTEKPYLTSGIKLIDVADQLGVSPHQLSQYLNQSKKTTFTAFMNSFRIQHAIEMLKPDAQKEPTILAVALESGFSNQANFIKVFKENTGFTPGEYRKSES